MTDEQPRWPRGTPVGPGGKGPGGGRFRDGWASRLTSRLVGEIEDPFDAVPLHLHGAIDNMAHFGVPRSRALEDVTGRIAAEKLRPGQEIETDGVYSVVDDVEVGGDSVTVHTEDDILDFRRGDKVRIAGLRIAGLPEMVDAAADYSFGAFYAEVNSQLRTGVARPRHPDTEAPPARMASNAERIAALERATTVSRTDRPMVVARVLDHLPNPDGWIEEGFSSVSADPDQTDFLLEGARSPVFLRMTVAPGTGAVTVSGQALQSEILLQRRLRYHRPILRGEHGGVRYYDVEVGPA